MQSNIAVKNEVVEGEIIEKTQPVIVQARMQIVVQNSEAISVTLLNRFEMLDMSLMHLSQKIERLSEAIDRDSVDSLDNLHKKIDAIAELFGSFPEWIPTNSLQESSGLTADAIRKQLKNPAMFEPEVDYKKIGRIWYIHKNAMHKIRRQK